jgi:small subunit ribosomal protein S16
MVRIRLRKVGSKAQQSFRIVAAEREHPRDGRFLENLGSYNPRTEPATIVIDEARVYHWLKNGAQPSDSVAQLFKVTGTLDRFARLKGGETVETLTAEADAAAAKRNVSSRTSGASAGSTRLSKKKKAAAAKAAAPAA